MKAQTSQSNGIVEVVFNNGLTDETSLVISTNYLPQWFFCDGRKDIESLKTLDELSAQEESAFKFAAECFQAEKAALALIARSEQNAFGLELKLRRRKFSIKAAKEVVSHLAQQNLLNDQRYAEAWLHARLALKKPYSPQWLLAALSKRGIDRHSSLKALDKVLDSQTEYDMLLKFVKKLHFPHNSAPFLKKSLLKYEGFSLKTVDRYFDEVFA